MVNAFPRARFLAHPPGVKQAACMRACVGIAIVPATTVQIVIEYLCFLLLGKVLLAVGACGLFAALCIVLKAVL